MDNLGDLSVLLGFQMMNSNLIEGDYDKENIKKNTSIVSSTPLNLDINYKKWFIEETEKIPTPAFDFEKVIYNDYGRFDDEKEKIEISRKEVGDIFKRDGTNYVKDDIIMNILRKLNKH